MARPFEEERYDRQRPFPEQMPEEPPAAPEESEVQKLAREIASPRYQVDPDLLGQAQADDRRETGMGRASDALYSAFARAPMKQRGESNRNVVNLQQAEALEDRAVTRGRADADDAQKRDFADPKSEASTTARSMFLGTPAGKEFAEEMGMDYFARLPASQIPGASELLRLAEGRRARDAAARAAAAAAAEARARDERNFNYRKENDEKNRANRSANASLAAGQRREAADRKQNSELTKAGAVLRDRLMNNPATKQAVDVGVSHGKMVAASADPSPAGDLALIFSFMKILDPGSVVKETEFANAQNAANVPDRVRNQWNRAMNGERLSAEQRADFLAQAERIKAAQLKPYEQIASEYGRLAEEMGLDRNTVVLDLGFGGQQRAAGAVGSGGVLMRGPDGAEGYVDEAEADEAAANGWERVE